MKTTKNKLVKGIKILANGPLYCAVFVSAGWGCSEPEKESSTIILAQDEKKLTAREDEDKNEGIINQDSHVLEQPNPEEVCAEPEPKQQSNISPKAALIKSSNKANPMLIPEKSDGSKSSSSNRQDMPSTKQKNDANKETELKPQVDDQPSKDTQDIRKTDHEELSSLKHSTEPLQGRTTQETSLDQDLENFKEKIKVIKKLQDEWSSLCTGNKLNKKQLKRIEKDKKLPEELKKIEAFCTTNSNPDAISKISNKLKGNEGYIQARSKLADCYIKYLQKLTT